MNGVTKVEEWVHFLLGIGCLLTAGTIFVACIQVFQNTPRDYAAFVSVIFAIYSCLTTGFANLRKAGV